MGCEKEQRWGKKGINLIVQKASHMKGGGVLKSMVLIFNLSVGFNKSREV